MLTVPFTPSDLLISFLIVIQIMKEGIGSMLLGNAAVLRLHDYGGEGGSSGLASSSRSGSGSKDSGTFCMMTSSRTHQSCNCPDDTLVPSNHESACSGTLTRSLPSTP